MTKSRLSEEQTVKILRRPDVMSMAQVARKHGVSEQTICLAQAVWAAPCGRCAPASTARAENERLKTLVAERDFEIELIREISRRKC